jgi:predicted phage terminase large subunit-like protein
MDDIEKLEEVDNPRIVEKTIRWVTNTILKMGDMHTRFLWLGTVLEKDCAFDQVLKGKLGFFGKRYAGVTSWSKRKDLWDMWGEILKEDISSNDTKLTESEKFYKKNREKMLVGAKVMWKEHRPYKFLMYQYYTEGMPAFFKEIQNNPKDIVSEYFIPTSVPMPNMKRLVKFLAIDPSLGKVMPSSIVCFGFDIHGGNVCYVFDQSTEKRGAKAIIEKAIELMKKHDINRFIVEVVQFQDLFKDILKSEVQKAGIKAIAIPFQSGEKKESRMEATQPLINQGRVVFTQNIVGTELWDELISYPNTKYVDAIDALSMGIAYIKEKLISTNASVPKSYVNSQLLYSRSYFDTINSSDKKFSSPKLASLIAQKRAIEAAEIKKILEETEQHDQNQSPGSEDV